MLVGAVVIADDMDLFVSRHGLVDQAQELQPFVMAMALLTEVIDLAGSSVQRRKQGSGSVAFVVVGHGLCPRPFFIGRPGWVRSRACI